MSDTNNQYDSLIRQLVPVNELSEAAQTKIINQSQILSFNEETYIFRQGDRDDYTFYLLDGLLEMEAIGEASFNVTTNEDRAKYPLAQVQPRKYSAKAKSPIKVLRVNRNALEGIVAQEKSTGDRGMDVDETDADESMDWMSLILQSSLFSRIPAANIQKLFVMLEPVQIKAGEVVIKQGDAGDYYYIIQEGQCEVTRQSSPRGVPVKLAKLNMGASFGEESLLSDKPRNATITMLTDGVLMRLSKENFIELIKKPTLDSISFDEAQKVIENGGYWLDVRSIAEFMQSNIKGSINIPIFDIRRESDKLQHNKQYVIYSNSKRRGSAAAFLLTELEFNVRYLENGLASIPANLKDQFLVKPETTEKAVEQIPDKDKSIEDTEDINRDEDLEKLDTFLVEKENTSEQIAIAAHKDQRVRLQERIKNIIATERVKLQEQEEVTHDPASISIKDEEVQKKGSEVELKKKELEELHERNLKEKAELQKLRQEAEDLIKKERESLQLSHAQQQAKLVEERRKMEEEAGKIHQTLKEIQAAKIEAEAARKAAEEEAKRLKEQQTLTEEDLTKTSLNILSNEIKSAESKLDQAEKKLIYAHQAEKTIVSAKELNEGEIKRHKEEAEIIQKQLEVEMAAWLKEQEEHDDLIQQAESHAEHIKKIREKTEKEKKESEAATRSLFDDIEKELHKE